MNAEDTNCLVIARKPDEHCVDAIGWRKHDGTIVPIFEACTGPEEHSWREPFFDGNGRYELYRSNSELTLLLFTHEVRPGLPSTDENRDYDWLRIFRGSDHGREWSMVHQLSLGYRTRK